MLDQRKNKFTRYIFYYLILLILCLLMLASRQNVPVDFQVANLILATSHRAKSNLTCSKIHIHGSFSQRNHETNPKKKRLWLRLLEKAMEREILDVFPNWFSFLMIFVADFSKGNMKSPAHHGWPGGWQLDSGPSRSEAWWPLVGMVYTMWCPQTIANDS